jgi:hypothetical protein
MLSRYAQAVSIDTAIYPFDKLPRTFKSEGHCCITKCAKWSDERCLDLVLYLEGDLVISQVAIEKT